MFTRLFPALRLSVANVGLALLAMAVALIAPVETGVSDAADGGQVVLCESFLAGSYFAHFGDCTNKVATGGSVKVNFDTLQFQPGDMTFRWANGKITVADIAVDIEIGACGGPDKDIWEFAGPIVKDTTGKVKQPVDILLCRTDEGWSLFSASF